METLILLYDLLPLVSVMANAPSKLLDELNKKGVFLQKFCFKEIKKAGWRAEEEFPVSLEYLTGTKQVIYESAGDIKATFPPKLPWERDYRLFVIVECTHRFEPHWIFIESDDPSKLPADALDVQYYPQGNLTQRASRKQSTFYYADLKLKEMGNCPLCTIGREVPELKHDDDRRYDSIFGACRQVSLATKSAAQECQQELELYGSWAEEYYPSHNIFIPIIVTTASVEICKYDIEDFQKEKVLKDASFIPSKWLAYRFPLPSYLRAKYKMRHPMDSQEMRKQTIFIVNHLHCSGFFTMLKKYFENMYPDILHEPPF